MGLTPVTLDHNEVSDALSDIILYRLAGTDTVNPLASLPDRVYQRIIEKKRRLELRGGMTNSLAEEVAKRMQVEFVYNSNKIEGNTLSRGETELILQGVTIRNTELIRALAGKNVSDILAVQNHPDAISFVKEMAFNRQRKVTEADIKELHRVIMNGIISSAGQYRTFDIQVRGAGFTPPPFYMVHDEMKELVEFVNRNDHELRPIELAAHAHYFLTWIHPFEDGNGRISRLLLNLILIRFGYPFAVIRNVERKQYLESLRRADRGEFQPFLNYIARCVEQTMDLYLMELEGHRGKRPRLQSMSELAKGTPYSAEYLSLLARKGMIDAVREGRIWKSTRKNIDTYIAEHGRRRK